MVANFTGFAAKCDCNVTVAETAPIKMERACACALSACAHECVCACVRAYVRVPLSVRVLTRTCACVCVRACVRVGARACVCARPGVLSTSRWSQQHTVFGSRRLPDDVIRGRGGHVRYVIGRN